MYGPYDMMDTNLRHSTFGPLNPLFWPAPPHVLNQLINYQRQLWPIPPAPMPDTPKSCRISPLNYTTESLTQQKFSQNSLKKPFNITVTTELIINLSVLIHWHFKNCDFWYQVVNWAIVYNIGIKTDVASNEMQQNLIFAKSSTKIKITCILKPNVI